MKVVQIETIYSNSGISGIVLSLMDALAANGDECRFAYGRERIPVPPERQSSVFRMESQPEIYLHALKSRLLDRSAFGSAAATRRLIRFLEEYDPDIIHLHSLLGYYINIKILFRYLAKAGKPVVWTQHDCWALTGHCIHFVNVGCEKWRTGCCHCPQIHTYPGSLFIDNSRRNYREKKALFTSVPDMTLVCPCEWLAGFARQSFLGKYPIRIIPNGIDLELYRPLESDLRDRYGIGQRKLLLGVASTWSPTKGLSVLGEVYRSLDHEEYALTVIGQMTDEQRTALPPDTVVLPRTTDLAELIKWYSAADVFLNPTTADTFPTVNLEALACGTPVITFPTGGSVESVNETCGLVTKEQTAASMLEAVRRLAANPPTREACLTKSKEYDRRERYADYVRLYHELAGK